MAIYPELKDRSVVITGAAGGIGMAAARAFHQQGAHVFMLDIDAGGVRAMAESLQAQGPSTARALPVDITDERGVNAAFASIDQAGLGLDVLINCAGGYRKLLTVEQLDTEEWDSTVALNLRSVFLCCRASIPMLKRSRAGRIINVTSISGRTVHAASSPAYGAAKAGVTQLTRFMDYCVAVPCDVEQLLLQLRAVGDGAGRAGRQSDCLEDLVPLIGRQRGQEHFAAGRGMQRRQAAHPVVGGKR